MSVLFGPGVAGHLRIRDGALQVLNRIDQLIDDGNRYYVTGYATVANGGTVDIALTTPDTSKWLHFITDVLVSDAMTIDLYENVTNISGGTELVPKNKNRNSANTSDAIIKVNPTSTLGDIIDGVAFGSPGGEARRIHKLILKQDTTYMWRLVSQADGNVVSYSGEWGEYVMENSI